MSRAPTRYFIDALLSGAFVSYNLGSLMTQRRLDKVRTNHKARTDQEHDMTRVQFACITHVRAGDREHTLWGGVLPGGRETFVACIDHKPGQPQHTRSLLDRNEALSYFSQFMPAGGLAS